MEADGGKPTGGGRSGVETLDDIVENAMRYLGYTFHEAECMTLREYSYEIHAYKLRQLDKRRDMHLQAYLSHVVTGVEKRGKKHVPVYPTFKDFFDFEKEERKLLQPKKLEDPSRIELMKAIASFNS